MSRAWTIEGLAAVSILARAGIPNRLIGDAVGRMANEVDLALWALVGCSPPQAVARLNLGGSAPVAGPVAIPSAALVGFMRSTHP